MMRAPERVLKTLMALVDRKPVCVIVPSDREVSMKKLGTALDGKSLQIMRPADAERISDYRVGGISPFGQTCKLYDLIYINGGQRGLQVRLKPLQFRLGPRDRLDPWVRAALFA